jgi:hypothetical protein
MLVNYIHWHGLIGFVYIIKTDFYSYSSAALSTTLTHTAMPQWGRDGLL